LILYYIFSRFLSGSFGTVTRRLLCRRIFSHVGKDVNIQPGVRFGGGTLITIGDSSGIGEGSYIVGMASISIGRDVMIAPQVMMLTGGHAYEAQYFNFYHFERPHHALNGRHPPSYTSHSGDPEGRMMMDNKIGRSTP